MLDYPSNFVSSTRSNSISGTFAKTPRSRKRRGGGFRRRVTRRKERRAAEYEKRDGGEGEQETGETVAFRLSKLCCAEKRAMWQRCVHALIHRDEPVSTASRLNVSVCTAAHPVSTTRCAGLETDRQTEIDGFRANKSSRISRLNYAAETTFCERSSPRPHPPRFIVF